jgi:hypothetical protein
MPYWCIGRDEHEIVATVPIPRCRSRCAAMERMMDDVGRMTLLNCSPIPALPCHLLDYAHGTSRYLVITAAIWVKVVWVIIGGC